VRAHFVVRGKIFYLILVIRQLPRQAQCNIESAEVVQASGSDPLGGPGADPGLAEGLYVPSVRERIRIPQEEL